MEENSKRFILENGKRRTMTKVESAKFSRRIERGQREGKQYRKIKQKTRVTSEKAKLKDQSRVTPTSKKIPRVSKQNFEEIMHKAQVNALKEHQKEFNKAKQHLSDAKQDILFAQQKGQLSDERATSMLESLSETELELSLQEQYIQQKITRK